jgi:hypothetical protein
MKPTLVTTLCFLLFALTTNFPIAFTQDAEQVKDTDGNPVVSHGEYYIYPASGTTGGGLKLGMPGNQDCPLTAVFEDTFPEAERSKGTRMEVFDYYDLEYNAVMSVGTQPAEFEVVVDNSQTQCTESNKWVMVNEIGQLPYVGIKGINDNRTIINGWFIIQKHGSGYKLQFCPISQVCVDIGRKKFDGEDVWRLVLNTLNIEDIFEFVFVRATA